MFKILSSNLEKKKQGEKEILALKTTKCVYIMSHRIKYEIPHSDVRNKKMNPNTKSLCHL